MNPRESSEDGRPTTQATLQISAVASQSRFPSIASGARYCRVWISSVKCLVDGVALPRSAILIDTGGGSGAGGLSDSAIGIGAVRIDTNPGRNEDIAGVVTGVGGGGGGDIAGVGVRDGEVAREVGGRFHVLVG